MPLHHDTLRSRGRNAERLTELELIAYEFFHHVHDRFFWGPNTSNTTIADKHRLSEFMEGAAFLFAALCVSRHAG